MKIVKVTSGRGSGRQFTMRKVFFGFVDDEDFSKVNEHAWYLLNPKTRTGGPGPRYARTALPGGSLRVGRSIVMSHFLLGAPPQGYVHMHINGIGLDCRKSNIATIKKNTYRTAQKKIREMVTA